MGAFFSRTPRTAPDALKLGDEISRGAYGVVYRGTLGTRPVAIKKIHQLLLDCAKERSEELAATEESFNSECELMEAIKHANVVEFIGVFKQDGSTVLVMELMHQTLEEFLEKNRGTLPLWKQVRICLKIALGLMFLHHHDPQILHRDLTAKNVLMNKEGSVVKISDLGQAKFRPSSVMYLTTKAPGCVMYMPPECLVDRPHFTDKGDVFSFGVVALQISTQKPPSCGLGAIGVQKEVERRSADLGRLMAEHPMEPIILQCLHDDPAKRPRSRGVVCDLQVEAVNHPPRDWKRLGKCQKVIQHKPGGGSYEAVAVNNEGLLAVTDGGNKCVHLLKKEGALVRSIGKGMLGSEMFGTAFDLKGNVWVSDYSNHKVVKLSQDGRLLQTIHHAGSEGDSLRNPSGVSVSAEGLLYICDCGNHRITVHDEDGKFLSTFASEGSGPGSFNGPCDMVFGPNGHVYATGQGNVRVRVWSKEGTFERDFNTNYDPYYVAATADNHLLITPYSSHFVMVYTLKGKLVHEFGGYGTSEGKLDGPRGICVDDNGVVYVADSMNKRVQVF